jgi:hypothetical protein
MKFSKKAKTLKTINAAIKSTLAQNPESKIKKIRLGYKERGEIDSAHPDKVLGLYLEGSLYIVEPSEEKSLIEILI